MLRKSYFIPYAPKITNQAKLNKTHDFEGYFTNQKVGIKHSISYLTFKIPKNVHKIDSSSKGTPIFALKPLPLDSS